MIRKKNTNYWFETGKDRPTQYTAIYYLLLLLLFLPIAQTQAKGGESKSYTRSASFPFPKAAPNLIQDESHSLKPFFERLQTLALSADETTKPLPITHIGDSHIQADMETATLRKLFQRYFGDAGRGLMAPLKLSKSNEPLNYQIASPQEWDAYRCIKPGEIPFGLTGLVLQHPDTQASVSLKNGKSGKIISDNPGETDVIVYYNTEKAQVQIADSGEVIHREPLGDYAELFVLKSPKSQFDFDFFSNEKDIRFYGIEMRENKPGIRYNAIGINGAHYSDYTGGNLFSEQLSLLGTELFILSLGTNEAYARNFSSDEFYNAIDRLIRSIRTHNPTASFILTTPAEGWKRIGRKSRRKIPNEKALSVRNVIVKYAQNNHLAYWDLFSIAGGKGSAKSWSKNNLYRKDGVHFTVEGYEYQGELLFEAIYNQYLKVCSTSKK